MFQNKYELFDSPKMPQIDADLLHPKALNGIIECLIDLKKLSLNDRSRLYYFFKKHTNHESIKDIVVGSLVCNHNMDHFDAKMLIVHAIIEKPEKEVEITDELIKEFNALSDQERISEFSRRQSYKYHSKFDKLFRIWWMKRY